MYKLLTFFICLISIFYCKPKTDSLSHIKFNSDQLFPEGIAYDSKKNGFYVSSLTKGNIYFVDQKGNISEFLSDPNWVSTIGIKYDEKRDRILVCASDFGAGEKSSEKTKQKIGYLSSYNATDKTKIFTTELSVLAKGNKILANDLAIDSNGNAYVTDSGGGKIYKVDINGEASLFFELKNVEKTSLNGILSINDIYLLVGHTSEGIIYKIPTNEKAEAVQVSISEDLKGIDGMSLLPDGKVATILNRQNRILILESNDEWKSAKKYYENTNPIFEFPTTSTIANGKLEVLNARLDKLMKQEKVSNYEIIEVFPISNSK